jgi:hypothetical protein
MQERRYLGLLKVSIPSLVDDVVKRLLMTQDVGIPGMPEPRHLCLLKVSIPALTTS